MTDITRTQPAAKRPRKMAREPKTDVTATASSAVPVAKPNDASLKPRTKASLVEALLARGEGASLDDLCQATGWLPHTCRAFLTGLRKKGKFLERSKRADGTTVYRPGSSAPSGDAEAAAPAEAAA